MEDNMTTGERIRNRRKELDISADKLADRIGVSRSTIFRYENGSIEKMPINTLIPIARALNTTVAYLMGWDDERQPAIETEDGFESEAKEFFDSLPESQKLEALNYLRYLSESTKKR
jgi:transcriptional regulator with XRE-family HTH domain